MEKVTTIVRILLGIIMVVFPVNALFIKAFKPKIGEKAQLVMDTFRESFSYRTEYINLLQP